MSYDYSENILVQESAGHLLADELGWQVELAYNQEVLGENRTFGRSSYKDILLVRYFQKALRTLNPWITDAQVIEAQNTFEKHLSSASLMQINEEKYAYIRDGIPVTEKKPNGQTEEKRAMIIDFQHSDDMERNHFLAVKEMKIHGDLYRRRTDRFCKWHSASLCRTKEEFCGCSECIYRQLHRLPGYHSAAVLLQCISNVVQWCRSQGWYTGQ